uniref:Integrase core domain containing protein n=1 Tax=Solanum tuberosum TaxID=4113 RepID=M1DN99_SOLTU
MQLLYEVSKNNMAWYTRDAEVGELGYTFELLAEPRKREEERDQDMAHMRTQIDLVTKHIVAKSEKVNDVEHQNKYEDQDIDLDKEANYLENQGGFRNYNSRNQGYNSGNAGRNYARDGNSNRESGSSSGSKLEDMMAKVLQKVDSTDAGVKDMRGGFSSMSNDNMLSPSLASLVACLMAGYLVNAGGVPKLVDKRTEATKITAASKIQDINNPLLGRKSGAVGPLAVVPHALEVIPQVAGKTKQGEPAQPASGAPSPLPASDSQPTETNVLATKKEIKDEMQKELAILKNRIDGLEAYVQTQLQAAGSGNLEEFQRQLAEMRTQVAKLAAKPV